MIGMVTLFDSPGAMIASLLPAVAASVVLAVRKRLLPGASRWLLGAGAIVLAIAAGRPLWMRPSPQPVAVMVDLSPSTRGAAYRDPAALKKRIDQLLGSTPRTIAYFAQDSQEQAPAPVGGRLPDLPAMRTIFQPPAAHAVLLFSDGRFGLPRAAPPVYPVVDPLLTDCADASVTQLAMRGASVAVSVANTTGKRVQLSLTGQAGPIGVAPGQYTLLRPVEGSSVTAQLSSDDSWPENNRLEMPALPPMHSQRWWVGACAPGAGWRAMAPGDLPIDAPSYLAPAAIVLSNIPGDALNPTQQQRLAQYVRDLGGSLVILGGEKAFAAGEYPGTPLERLSPLASSPPAPTMHWIILADASGSMSSAHGATTRWELAREAILKLLPHLPPEDPVTLGSFSDRVDFWSRGQSARETLGRALPDVHPNGPTNLEPALREILNQTDAGMPSQLLLLSDADAPIEQPGALAQAMVARKMSLHVLVLGANGRGLVALSRIARQTGGSVVQEIDPSRWAAAARKLFATASPDRLVRRQTSVKLLKPIEGFGPESPEVVNRTWLKRDAVLLAESDARDPLIARWRAGAGQVVAVAYASGNGAVLAQLIAAPPHDPRLQVTWNTGAAPSLHVEAADGGRPLNQLPLQIQLISSNGRELGRAPVPQTAPGEYDLELPVVAAPALASLQMDGQVVDRAALAARYAPEFDAVGINADAIKALARRTGGAVIPPAQTGAIRFDFPAEPVPLASILAVLGVGLIAAGLVRWRLS